MRSASYARPDTAELLKKLVPQGRIELPTSPLPRVRSTTELLRPGPPKSGAGAARLQAARQCHRPAGLASWPAMISAGQFAHPCAAGPLSSFPVSLFFVQRLRYHPPSWQIKRTVQISQRPSRSVSRKVKRAMNAAIGCRPRCGPISAGARTRCAAGQGRKPTKIHRIRRLRARVTRSWTGPGRPGPLHSKSGTRHRSAATELNKLRYAGMIARQVGACRGRRRKTWIVSV